MNELLYGAAVVVIVGVILFGISNNNKITDYYRVCAGPDQVLSDYSSSISAYDMDAVSAYEAESKAIADCTTWNNLTADTYVVDQNTQTVVDQPNLTKLSDCTIADTDNWSCYDGGMGFTDGKYFIKNGDLLPTEHFGKYAYWWYMILSHLGINS